jgi:23S rRNA G2445 N2-methylase RlmL
MGERCLLQFVLVEKSLYAVNCVAGLETVVASLLAQDIPSMNVEKIEGGYLMVSSHSAIATELLKLDYVSGALEILATFKFTCSFEETIREFAVMAQRGQVKRPTITWKTFRVRAFDEGRPVGVERRALREMEIVLSALARAKPNRALPEGEVWIYRRSRDTSIYIAARLDLPKRKTAAGGLKSDFAATMVRIVPPREIDRVLDPFAGSGSLSAARAKFPARTIVASDIDPGIFNKLLKRRSASEFGPRSRALNLDFFDIDQVRKTFDRGAFNVVISDPPWGDYENWSSGTATRAYQKMWNSISYCLDSDGRATLLQSRNSILESLAPKDFAISSRFQVLVNGKKADVVSFSRETH